jgi:hypothetical protein
MGLIKSDCKGVERFANEENDCTVRALANVMGLPYPLAHKIMTKAGREIGKGVRFDTWHEVYTRFGLSLLSVHGTTQGARYIAHKIKSAQVESGGTLAKIMPRLRSGRFVVKVRGHVFAVIDGKILDYGNNPAGSKVQAIYKLEQQAVIFDR